VRLVRAGELHAQRARAEAQDKECACAEEAREMERLERYVPGEPAIKVSLGLVSGAFLGEVLACLQGADTAFWQNKSAYQVNGAVGTKAESNEDLDVGVMWGFWGHPGVDEQGMFA
jgi:hypothetical protein